VSPDAAKFSSASSLSSNQRQTASTTAVTPAKPTKIANLSVKFISQCSLNRKVHEVWSYDTKLRANGFRDRGMVQDQKE